MAIFDEEAVNERIDDYLHNAVWRAVADHAAKQSAALDLDMRAIAKAIRKDQQSVPTILIHPNTPFDIDYCYPALIVRSSNVPEGTAYILPAAQHLEDLLLENDIEL